MLESEAYLVAQDGGMERLYVATGYGLIQCVKGLMSYEDADLLAGITHTKQDNHIASLHRKKAAFLGSRLAGYAVSSVSSTLPPGSVQWIKSMTDVERHAELVYAESICNFRQCGCQIPIMAQQPKRGEAASTGIP